MPTDASRARRGLFAALLLTLFASAAAFAQTPASVFVDDLVGYGPCPMECIERIAALQKQGKLAWVAGKMVSAGECESSV